MRFCSARLSRAFSFLLNFCDSFFHLWASTFQSKTSFHRFFSSFTISLPHVFSSLVAFRGLISICFLRLRNGSAVLLISLFHLSVAIFLSCLRSLSKSLLILICLLRFSFSINLCVFLYSLLAFLRRFSVPFFAYSKASFFILSMSSDKWSEYRKLFGLKPTVSIVYYSKNVSVM